MANQERKAMALEKRKLYIGFFANLQKSLIPMYYIDELKSRKHKGKKKKPQNFHK